MVSFWGQSRDQINIADASDSLSFFNQNEKAILLKTGLRAVHSVWTHFKQTAAEILFLISILFVRSNFAFFCRQRLRQLRSMERDQELTDC